MVKRKGSYTVEAVFVMTISVFVILALCYAAMFMHDKAAVLSAGHYILEPEPEKKQSKKELEEILEGKLFLIRINHTAYKDQIFSRKITVHYSLSLSVPLLKRALLGDDGTAQITVEQGKTDPVVLMWDAATRKGDTNEDGNSS